MPIKEMDSIVESVSEKKLSEKLTIPQFDHPGGQSLLALGRRSPHPDLLFLCYHLGHDIDGKIESVARKKNVATPSRGALFRDLHQAAIKVRQEHPYEHWVFFSWCLFVTIALPLTFGYFVVAPNALLAVLSGLLWVTYSFNIFHMRHHKGGVLYGVKWLDQMTGPFYDFLEGTWAINPESWIENHQGSHHLFTNSDELDHDVWQPFPLLRLHPKQEKSWFHAFQSFYAPIIFLGSTISFPFDNLLVHKTGPIPFLSWFTLSMLLPFYTSGWVGVGYVFCMYFITGTMMAYLFQVSHNHTSLGPRNEEIVDFDSWAKCQVEESVSWGGYLSCLFFGGINFQVEHHVFPALDSTLYYYLAPELKKISEKYGIRYTYESTFFHAIREYHSWLNLMGNQKQGEE